MKSLNLILSVLTATTVLSSRAQDFTKVANGSHVTDGGFSFYAAWMDYDADGDNDIYICNWENGPGQHNFLYRNDGNHVFTRVTDIAIAQEGGSLSMGFGDFDNDGYADVFLANPGTGGQGQKNSLYINDGAGNFLKITTGPLCNLEETTTWANVVDFNNDGLLDIFYANHNPPSGPVTYENRLFKNDGETFVLIDNTMAGLSDNSDGRSAFADFDNDGDMDLFLSRKHWIKNEMYLNNGDETYNHISTGNTFVEDSCGFLCWGDFDNDGDLDVFITESENHQGDGIYFNLGNNQFQYYSNAAMMEDSAGNYCSPGDYDNDGDLDVFVACQTYYQARKNCLYRNEGDGSFVKVTEGILANDLEPSSCGSWCDFDMDGDLDLFLANVNNWNNSMYLNNGNDNHWIVFRCFGTSSNVSAIGTMIRIKASINGTETWQMRELSGQDRCLDVHFGLGNAAMVDSLIIAWPSGLKETITDLPADQYVMLNEGNVSGMEDRHSPLDGLKLHIWPNPSSGAARIRYQIPDARYQMIKIFSIDGRKIRELVNQEILTGEHEIQIDVSDLPAGLYFVKMQLGDEIAVRKLVVGGW